ncbi:replication protein RepA [Edaphobacter modestus]|uniref:RepA protein n=1 Tax=Edaphobacter modestus TaxID=388466 RepID=A0A4Q7YVZ8_9BACT|nr:replication protein RepA [Edaphobacter modestus]RZU41341.1 RepA protein [Edaphobacter modestus]
MSLPPHRRRQNLSPHFDQRVIDLATSQHFELVSGEVYQVAQALILCGLPYQPTSKSKITRQAILANGNRVSVTFSTALEGSMPFGSDRSLLHFLLDKAVKMKSRFVNWETATEFLLAMRMAQGGKNRRDLRERFIRLRGLTIGVERRTAVASEAEIMPVIRRSRLPTSLERRAERYGQHRLQLDEEAYGIEIDEVFFEELIRHHVPIPEELIQATRRQSQLQDHVLFLCWRCYAAQNESLIPWEYLRQQLWQDDTNEWRIRERFARAIRVLRAIWPQLRAEATTKGLCVAPPDRSVYLTPGAAIRRRLS